MTGIQLSKKQYLGATVLVIGIVILFLFHSPNPIGLVPPFHRAATYDEAVSRIQNLQMNDGKDINVLCHTLFLSHGKKTDNVVVYFHGYTSCPEQFHELGNILFDKGDNVLVVRIPHHGLADNLTDDLKNITAQELVINTTDAIGIAAGLGDNVTVVGLSGGGVTAAWAAQNLSSISKTVIIDPIFGIQAPPFLNTPITNILLIAPNHFIWWDPKLKNNSSDASYGYRRYSTKSLAQYLKVGLIVQKQAKQIKPLSPTITVITNESDTAVNNALTAILVRSWKENGTEVKTYQFPKALRLDHNLIDPTKKENTKITFPVILDAITNT